MPGLIRGGWKRGRVSGPPSLRCSVWTAPDHHDHRASRLLYRPRASAPLRDRYRSGRIACAVRWRGSQGAEPPGGIQDSGGWVGHTEPKRAGPSAP